MHRRRYWFGLLIVTYFAFPAIAVSSNDTLENDDRMIAALIEALDDPDSEVRLNLAVSLSQLGAKSVPALILALESDSPYRRAGAAYALSQLRSSARTALPALLKTLKDKDSSVRRHASYAISRIVSASERSVAASAVPEKPIVVPPLEPIPNNLPNPGIR